MNYLFCAIFLCALLAACKVLSNCLEHMIERRQRRKILRRFGQCTFTGCEDVRTNGDRCTKHRITPRYTIDFLDDEKGDE